MRRLFFLFSARILLSSTFSCFTRSQRRSDISRPCVFHKDSVFFLHFQILLWIDTFSLVPLNGNSAGKCNRIYLVCSWWVCSVLFYYLEGWWNWLDLSVFPRSCLVCILCVVPPFGGFNQQRNRILKYEFYGSSCSMLFLYTYSSLQAESIFWSDFLTTAYQGLSQSRCLCVFKNNLKIYSKHFKVIWQLEKSHIFVREKDVVKRIFIL